MRLKSWGCLPYVASKVEQLKIQDTDGQTGSSKFLPIGSSRSYGDVGLNPGGLVCTTTHLNKFLSFDEISGVLECEPGVLIREIQIIFAHRGWVSPVTPGTSFVTVGGAIANDVHGKNHHSQGSFGNHVLEIDLARSDGQVLTCSDEQNRELFEATIGGLGLTGVILRAKVQLARVPSPWVQSEKLIFGNLEEFFRISEESEAGFESTVAWLDCSTKNAGRGSFIRGSHVPSERPNPCLPTASLGIPFTPYSSLVNRATVGPLNTAYFHLQKSTTGPKLESMWPFYYPLDSLGNWNRAYGRKGFYQYQSVIPAEHAKEVTQEMVDRISKSRLSSFLAVLKTFGPVQSRGLISFPMEGVSLAVDFPNAGERTEHLFRDLDRLVVQSGGRLNPSKDARMSRTVFESGFPKSQQFELLRDARISSGFSRRIFGS